MKYEVEQKYRVNELRSVQGSMVELGGVLGAVLEQVDRYFAHPSRDFAETDEALRIRRVGDDCRVTYKGPKIDRKTKTRREIELPLPPGSETVDQYTILFEVLGFQRVAEVRKRRQLVHVPWEDTSIEAALDVVEGVGQFVELELTAGPSDLEVAKRRVGELARELGLTDSERRSYLELLLESRG